MTRKHIEIDGGVVCAMRKSVRARCLRLAVRSDGSVTLTLPLFVSYQYGEKFVASKREWIRQKVAENMIRSKRLLCRGDETEYRKLRASAKQLVEDRLSYFQSSYDVLWKRISIRNQKTRWGSCSHQGHLSFNYRIVLLPAHLRDYVIVHELCHLLVFNHSAKFWSSVAKTIPHYRECRKELRQL